MRESPRPRHLISRRQLTMLRPLLRFSAGRQAYVLRGVGRYVGPVFQLAPDRPAAELTRHGLS